VLPAAAPHPPISVISAIIELVVVHTIMVPVMSACTLAVQAHTAASTVTAVGASISVTVTKAAAAVTPVPPTVLMLLASPGSVVLPISQLRMAMVPHVLVSTAIA